MLWSPPLKLATNQERAGGASVDTAIADGYPYKAEKCILRVSPQGNALQQPPC